MEYFMNKQILAFTLRKTVLVSLFNWMKSPQMLILENMKKTSEDINKLRAKAEASMNKTAQLQQALAKIEAALSRKENQKVSQKSQKL